MAQAMTTGADGTVRLNRDPTARSDGMLMMMIPDQNSNIVSSVNLPATAGSGSPA
jgi:hypothetical protein